MRDRVRAVLGDEKTSVSTFAHILTELDDELLVSRSRRAVFELTPLGTAAVEAQREYQAALLPVVSATDRLESRLGKDLFVQISQLILENSRRPRTTVVPWILDVMRLQSNNARLNILLCLAEGEIDFQNLRSKIAEDMPQSTLSNLITELEKRELLNKEGKPKRSEFRLTELGLASIEAYDGYQERLIHPFADAVRLDYERDLGISKPSQPRITEPAKSIYPQPFETMLEYVMRTTY